MQKQKNQKKPLNVKSTNIFLKGRRKISVIDDSILK